MYTENDWRDYQTKKNDELFHHGILGQKWGIRRYQNKDGSLTPAGRKKYAKILKKAEKLTFSKKFDKLTARNVKMMDSMDPYKVQNEVLGLYKGMTNSPEVNPAFKKLVDESEKPNQKFFNKLTPEDRERLLNRYETINEWQKADVRRLHLDDATTKYGIEKADEFIKKNRDMKPKGWS